MNYLEYLKPNPKIYNPDAEYGGNQCSPNIIASAKDAENNPEYQQLCLIVKSHFPEMTQKEIHAFLLKLDNESCAYVAMINTLFEELIDRPQDFYNAFGFHMYDPDGSLNYNQILVDLYCKKDNHSGQKLLFWTFDHYNENEDREWKDENNDGTYEWVNKPYGNTDEMIKYRWESYCKEHGVDVQIFTSKLINTKNYYRHRKHGYITISAADFQLTDDTCNTSSPERGHAMTITGVTEDKKKFIVSSWGQRYYIDPKNDIKGRLHYRIVKYKKKIKQKRISTG